MRGVIKFGLTIIVVVIVAWVGLWWYAQGRLQTGFTGWASTLATQGWKVSYDSIKRGTSPTQAAVTITNLAITSPPAPTGQTITIALPSLTLHIDAATPLVFHADLPNKVAANSGQFNGVINTTNNALAENLDPNALFDKTIFPFRGGDFTASNVDILASSILVLHIDSITEHFTDDLKASAAQTALAGTTALDGVALSPLFTRIASIPFDGKVNHLGVGLTLSGPVPANLQDLGDQLKAVPHDKVAQQKILVPVIHKWAAQGGAGSFSLGLAIGPSTANADAAIKFDANLQPEGTANLTADHLDQFTAAVVAAYPQAQSGIAQVEAQLTPYITTTDAGGQTLTLHVTYGAGAVSVNGSKVADLPPVDWTSLENPPPAAATAPGQ